MIQLWEALERDWGVIGLHQWYVTSSTGVGASNALQIMISRHVVAEKSVHHAQNDLAVVQGVKKKPPLN